MLGRRPPPDNDDEDAVLTSIDQVASNLEAQVRALQEFIAQFRQLRPPTQETRT
jgi:hypothetical protein